MHRLHRLIRLLVVPVALAALLAAAGPAQAAPGNWWQFGYTAANTRYNPNDTTIGPANAGRLVVGAEQAPTLGPGWNASQASGVAVAGGRVVVASGSGLRAVDAATGALRWNLAVAAAGSPAVANGLVYAGLEQGIGAWRLSDGAQRWRTGAIPYGSPSVSSGRVYASAVKAAGPDRYIALVDQFRLDG